LKLKPYNYFAVLTGLQVISDYANVQWNSSHNKHHLRTRGAISSLSV